MKKILLTASLCVFILAANAQYTFEAYNNGVDTINVFENNRSLQMPFAGGMDVPQFSHIDLNNDGKKDIVTFDREGYRVSTYINIGGPNQIKYEYDPQYVKAFQKMLNWLLLVD